MDRNAFFRVPEWMRERYADPFRRFLILTLLLLGGLIAYHDLDSRQQTVSGDQEIAFFFHPQCPHCRRQKAFIPYLQAKYPELPWRMYDISRPENAELLKIRLQQHGQPVEAFAVPMTFIGPYLVDGFDGAETTGRRLEQAVRALLRNDPSLFPDTQKGGGDRIVLPVFGEITIADTSLTMLAIVIGLVDGFNPCAMWVLVYLISVIAGLNDRRKIWLLVGTFVAASGILYFLFMTAWLNIFLFLGYLRLLTLGIGLGALGAGILFIRDYLRTKGEVTCSIGDAASRRRTMNRVDRIVDSPITFFSVFSIIVLAFVVNSIEFACSAALPAIFTHTLTLRDLPTLHYYGYILLYDLFFMLDDLLIFGLAVFALDTGFGRRYASHCRVIGGIVLILLGGMMVFRPDLLR